MSQRAHGTSEDGTEAAKSAILLPSAGDCVNRGVYTPPEPRHLHWNAKSLFILHSFLTQACV